MMFAITMVSIWLQTVQCDNDDLLGDVASLSLIETFSVNGWIPESAAAVYDPKNDEYLIGRILGFEILVQDPDTLNLIDNKTISNIVTPASMVVIPDDNILYVNSPLASEIVGFDLTTS